MNTSAPALRPAGTATAAVTDKHLLRSPGWWLLLGSALWWVAALILTAELSGGDFFFADTAREEALLLAAPAQVGRGEQTRTADVLPVERDGVVHEPIEDRQRRDRRLVDDDKDIAGDVSSLAGPKREDVISA